MVFFTDCHPQEVMGSGGSLNQQEVAFHNPLPSVELGSIIHFRSHLALCSAVTSSALFVRVTVNIALQIFVKTARSSLSYLVLISHLKLSWSLSLLILKKPFLLSESSPVSPDNEA